MIHVQRATDVKTWLAGLLLAILLLPASAYAQTQKTVTGTVIDEMGETVIGASVKAVNASAGAITDFDGNFTLKVPAEVKQLTISYVGYITQTVDITSDVIRVQLKPDNQLLEEVVVVGYGVTRKSDLTGSVSTVKADDFNGGTINSPEQLINGKISGVQIMSSGGSPSAGNTIRIRGGASLNASNDPLIVVDGVPLESGGITGSGNFMSMINPADIESMTVLKDASSTAIYGSRASNGVLLITTKKGSSDRVKVSFVTNNSFSTKTKTSDVLSADQFRSLINEQGSDTQKSLLGTADTDWTNEIFHTAFATDNNVSVSGKAGFLPFRVSVGYLNQAGILRSDKLERYTGSVVLNPSFFDDHLTLTLNAKGSVSETRFADTGAIYNAASFNPTVPVYSGNDRFGGYFESVSPGGVPDATLNPVGLLDYVNHQGEVKRVIGNFDIDYKFHFLPDLKAHVSLGLDYAEGYGLYYCPDGVGMNYQVGGSNNKYGPQTNTNKLFTAYLNYSKNVENIKSNFDVTVGYDYQSWIAKTVGYDQYNVFGEVQSTVAPTDQRHLLISYYGRLNYSFDNRYLLTATMRSDGTSRFSPDDRWGYFPSVGIGWRLNEENFMKDVTWLDNLSLKVSYGQQGNDNLSTLYAWQSLYDLSWANEDQIGAFISTLENRDVSWEKNGNFNVGIEAMMFDNRLSINAEYYNKKTTDMLLNYPMATSTGFNGYNANIGDMRNSGFEFEVKVTPIKTNDLTWNITWMGSTVKNKVLKLTGESPEIINGIYSIKEGMPINTFYMSKAAGVDPATGAQLYWVYDTDAQGNRVGEEYISSDYQKATNSKYYMGSRIPDLYGSIGTDLSWKGIDFSFLASYSIGGKVFDSLYQASMENLYYNNGWNEHALRRWQKPGDITDVPRIEISGAYATSDRFLVNASYFAIKNITLGYTLPKTWMNKAKLNSVRIFASVDNLALFSHLQGMDPQYNFSGSTDYVYTPNKTWSLGFELNF